MMDFSLLRSCCLIHTVSAASTSTQGRGTQPALRTTHTEQKMQTSLHRHPGAFRAASKPVRVQQIAPSRHASLVRRQSQRVRAIELVSWFLRPPGQQQPPATHLLCTSTHRQPSTSTSNAVFEHGFLWLCTHPHPQDFSDPDTQLSVAGVVLGLVLGVGAPAFYINRTERDEERLEELRALNRAQYQETGEYMSDVSAHWRLQAQVPCWLWVGSDASSLASSMLPGMGGDNGSGPGRVSAVDTM